MSLMKKFLLFLLLGSSPLLAKGLGVSPMEQFIYPGQAATYLASNQMSDAIAVEVVAEAWTITKKGEEVLTPTDDLVIYPSQFILKGHTQKRVKVVSKSRKKIPVEKTYRVTLRELPIPLNPKLEDVGTVQIYHASAYRTSFYLKPRKTKADLQITGARIRNKTLYLRFHNPGTVHFHLLYPDLVLQSANGEEYEISDQKILNSMSGQNMHAQITREFALPLKDLPISWPIVSAKLKFDNGNVMKNKLFKLNFEKVR